MRFKQHLLAKHFSATLIVALLIPTAGLADWIRLGSWNIEHLGEVGDTSAPVALAEHLHRTGLDAIVFQEIYDNDDDSLTRTNSQLDKTLTILNSETGQNWVYEMFPNRYSGDESQLISVAWNKNRLDKSGDTLRLDIERDNNEWDRHPHAIKLSAGQGKTDIVIVGIHMKADYGADYSKQRDREAELLIDSLEDVKTTHSDSDIVLIGDFNSESNAEPAIKRFESAGFRDLNWKDAETHVTSGPLDRILVPSSKMGNTASEFSFSRQYRLTAADEFTLDKYLSDHMMVVTSIRIMDDDD